MRIHTNVRSILSGIEVQMNKCPVASGIQLGVHSKSSAFRVVSSAREALTLDDAKGAQEFPDIKFQ